VDEALPAGQLVHLADPLPENVPAGQLYLQEDRSLLVSYTPAGHEMHDHFPPLFWNMPGGHTVHEAAAADEKRPTAQFAHELKPAEANLPWSQP